MSRRVFDVGLDMGRIKNGLKISKSDKSDKSDSSKRSKSHRSASTSNTYTDESAYQNLNQQVAVVPRLPGKKSSPTMRAMDVQNQNLTPVNDTVVLPSPGSPISAEFPIPPSPLPRPSMFGREHSSPDTHHQMGHSSPGDHGQNFDLRPPPPNKPVKLLDSLSERLFSAEHLEIILRDPAFFLRFTTFINRYQPSSAPVLVRYLEAQKAIKAVDYANALAESIKPLPGEHSSQIPCAAATIDARFEARAKRALDSLVHDALPAYITFGLVKVVTETIVREITGTAMPVMRELVAGSAEVFCLSDPNQKDNPIVYASEGIPSFNEMNISWQWLTFVEWIEFYRTTQYGRDYVIGKNCRFLQGPKTDRACITRIKAAVQSGQEVFETVLNYRRDGSPFMNLVMVAPLYDNRGIVRYFIGAQIDVSGLIEDGRGLDSFERTLLEGKSRHRNQDSSEIDEDASKKPLRALNEFGQLLSVEESSALAAHSRSSSMQSNVQPSVRGTNGRRDPSVRLPRRVVLGAEEDEDGNERHHAWAQPSLGPSGKLPGVYQNYLLVRPYPSLRIIFVSSALRIPGLLQSPFLSRIGGPAHVRDGLSDAFEKGDSVTAKVMWLPQGRNDNNENDNASSRPSSRHGNAHSSSAGGASKARYISCTPLLGSDDQVGVWMVVMVENEQVTGSLPSRERTLAPYNQHHQNPVVLDTPSYYEREDAGSGGGDGRGGKAWHARQNGSGTMYAEWMKNSRGGGMVEEEDGGFAAGDEAGGLDLGEGPPTPPVTPPSPPLSLSKHSYRPSPPSPKSPPTSSPSTNPITQNPPPQPASPSPRLQDLPPTPVTARTEPSTPLESGPAPPHTSPPQQTPPFSSSSSSPPPNSTPTPPPQLQDLAPTPVTEKSAPQTFPASPPSAAKPRKQKSAGTPSKYPAQAVLVKRASVVWISPSNAQSSHRVSAGVGAV